MTEQTKESTEAVIPRAFVTRVTTNLKTPGEKPRSLALGPLTLIVGPSGSGKTSYVDAVCLALEGESPTRGLGKAPANLKRALPSKADALLAQIELSNGVAVAWSLERAAQKAVWPGAVGTVLSASDGLDLLLGMDKGRLLSILEAVPATEITVTGIDLAVSGIDRDLALRLEGSLPSEGEVISPARLRQVVRTLDSLTSEFTRAISACESFKGGGLSNAEGIELTSLEQAFALDLGATYIKGELSRVEKQLAAASTEVSEHAKMIETEVPGYFQSTGVADATVELLKRVATRLSSRGEATAPCPGCGAACSLDGFNGRREKLEAALARGRERIQGWLEQYAYNLIAQERLTARRAVLEDLLTSYGAAAVVDTPRLVELRQRKAEAALALAAGSRASALAGSKKRLEAILDVLLGAAAQAAPTAADIVRRRMNKVLPKGREARILCEDRAVRIGQSINKGPVVPCGALSGSERAVFAAALAIALQPAREQPVSLLVVDEVMFDRKTLKLVLAGLSRASDADAGPTQIIVCASEWSGKVPAGWTLCEIAEETETKPEEKPEEKPEGQEVTSPPPETAENPAESTANPPAGGFLDGLI